MNGTDNWGEDFVSDAEKAFYAQVQQREQAEREQLSGLYAAPASSASAILMEAARTVAGPRNDTHGKPERSFETIAAYWTVYLDNRRDQDAPLRGSDVAAMMELLKLARDQHSPQPFRDHALDGAGYAAIRGELRAKEAA